MREGGRSVFGSGCNKKESSIYGSYHTLAVSELFRYSYSLDLLSLDMAEGLLLIVNRRVRVQLQAGITHHVLNVQGARDTNFRDTTRSAALLLNFATILCTSGQQTCEVEIVYVTFLDGPLPKLHVTMYNPCKHVSFPQHFWRITP